jgi:serine/threonine-protein kinase PpkA
MAALAMPEWETAGKDGGPIQQRYVVVISDASPKPPGDPSLPANIRRLGPQEVWQLAQNKHVTLAAIHVLTPDGRPNAAMARAFYKRMTPSTSSGQSLYDAVDLTGDTASEADFLPIIRKFSDFVVSEHSRPLEELQRAQRERSLTPIEEASLAMRLRWLGETRNASAPDLIEAFTLDVAIENPLVPALELRLLVTKNQLSTMRDVLAEVVRVGEITQGEFREDEFFSRLRGALARMAQDPNALINTRFETLGQAVGEFLDGLPYRSQILDTVTEAEWMNMGHRRRIVLDRVSAKQQQYELFATDDRLWTELYPGAPDGERVYAMPLSALP